MHINFIQEKLLSIPPYLYSRLYHYGLPVLGILPIKYQVKIASYGRQFFMDKFSTAKISQAITPPENLSKTLWGIKFRSPLFNSAGMFKNGDGYSVVASLGAGGYIGGTSTANQRMGNAKSGIGLPFITLPHSSVAINWLGLPNQGDTLLSQKIITRNKVAGCPIGWSLMRSPDYQEEEGLRKLIDSLWLYHANEQIDFLEINESCPNIKSSGGSILPRMKILGEEFLQRRNRSLPVILKISNDINEAALREIIRYAIRYKFDGVNLGNTSTAYSEVRKQITAAELKKFDYFINVFGGGISGKVLQNKSLNLCAVAIDEIRKIAPAHEFHVIRSGGVSSVLDIIESEKIGVALNQWYTGFFDSYTESGNEVYSSIYHLLNASSS